MAPTPSDLIQEVLDILAGDNQQVRIMIQGTGHGGVLIMTGKLIGLDGDNYALVDDLTIQGSGSRATRTFPIHTSSIIEIRPVTGEEV